MSFCFCDNSATSPKKTAQMTLPHHAGAGGFSTLSLTEQVGSDTESRKGMGTKQGQRHVSTCTHMRTQTTLPIRKNMHLYEFNYLSVSVTIISTLWSKRYFVCVPLCKNLFVLHDTTSLEVFVSFFFFCNAPLLSTSSLCLPLSLLSFHRLSQRTLALMKAGALVRLSLN